MLSRLFLTSQASLVLPKLIPHLERSPHHYHVAFIPTAAKPYAHAPWMHNDRTCLVQLGFKVTDVDVSGISPYDLAEVLSDIDILFVAGGDTFHLLEKSLASGFDHIVKRLVGEGVWYIGSSAGSVIAGPDIEPVRIFDDPDHHSTIPTRGFGLIDLVILPHFGNPKYAHYHERVVTTYGQRFQLVPLTDSQVIYAHDGIHEILS